MEQRSSRLQVRQTIRSFDVATALGDDDGAYFVQGHGQNYIAISRRGHSLTSLTPVGEPFEVMPRGNLGPAPWVITKISNDPDSYEQGLQEQGQLTSRQKQNQ